MADHGLAPDAPPQVEVSVVLPVRDGARVIGTQLRALIMQTDAPRFEVIVVDNGSTDGTADHVRAFAGRLPPGLDLRVVDARDDAGASYARNVGIANARASKLLFCDADDCVSEHWVRQGAELLDLTEVFSGAAVSVPDADFGGDVARLREMIGDRPEVGPLRDDQRDTAFPVLMGGTFGMKREVAFALGGFDQSLPVAGEDNDLALRIRELGFPVQSTPCARIAYRIRTGPGDVWKESRRAARAHALNAVRHGLWAESTLVGRGRWLSGWLRAGLSLIRWLLVSPGRGWTDMVGRLAVAQGALEGAVMYRILRRVPAVRLGVGLVRDPHCRAIAAIGGPDDEC